MNETLLTVKNIQEKWNLSRQTIQTAIKKKEIQGKKDPRTNRWQFEFQEIIRWKGEPWSTPVNAPAQVKAEADPEVVALLKKQLEEQKNSHQKQLEDKDKEIERLVVQIDRKDEQIKHQMLLEDKNKGWFKKIFS